MAEWFGPLIVPDKPVKTGRPWEGRMLNGRTRSGARRAALAGLTGWWVVAFGAPALATDFTVSFPASVEREALTGRVILVVAPDGEAEPRQTISLNGPPIFGMDVEDLRPGQSVRIGTDADSYPLESLSQLPDGDYHLQAVLVRYTEVTRADGHTIDVPISHRRVFAAAMPGNLYSVPVRVRVAADDDTVVALSLDQVIAPLPELEDTPWIRRVRIRSDILSDFWGVPMYLGASVLIPRGFDADAGARYPAIYVFGHGDTPFGFNPDPDSHAPGVARARDANVETGYEFFQAWTSDDFPRVVAITLEHPSPYFVESYAVNSANNGPYGDAITRELIPYLEREFRLIPAPHARIVEGASTGGWEALALQLTYPEIFGGAWVFNPDPISFDHYQLIDIYDDTNMFTTPVNAWMTAERPFRRTREGQPVLSVREIAAFEAVLGSRGRSGYQLDIWQATHGPVGEDGYPALLFDKQTGQIDPEVATYMRAQGYDLTARLRDNWEALSPLVAGKLNLFAGEMDDFYLNLGVYEFEDMVRELGGPDYPIRFEYGRPMKGHNWHHTDWAGVVREMAEHVEANAPEGEESAR